MLVLALTLLSGVGYAEAADLVYNADTTVTTEAPATLLPVVQVATSIEVGATYITVVVPDPGYFTFKSLAMF